MLAVDARDGGGLAERAAAFRSRDPRIVLVVACDSREAHAVAPVLEAAQIAAVGADEGPRLIVAGHPDVLAEIREVAGGVAFDRAGAPTEDRGANLVGRLRALRGKEAEALTRIERTVTRTGSDDVLACEVDEE
ncbi:MAG TPA: hypothetical protein VJQ09_09045, partial [Candidatus Limnocylindria bacterium]|nr:hypothetical protein [Candidatus Limnocylindria bacterium]